MNIKFIVSVAMAFAIGCSVQAAGENKATAGTKGAPIINMELSSHFGKYLARKDELTEAGRHLTREEEINRWKADGRKLQDDVRERVEKENKSRNKKIVKLEKRLDALDKGLEKAGENEKRSKTITKQMDEVERDIFEMNRLSAAYSVFEIYCSTKQAGIESTSLGMVRSNAPEIKAKTLENKPADFTLKSVNANYKVLVFFSMKNRASLRGYREALGLSGKKPSRKTTAVIAINVDTTEKEIALAKNDLKKNAKKCTGLHDADWTICGAYKVGFLPHAVLIDDKGLILKVVVGDKVRGPIHDAIKANEKKIQK